MPECRTGPASPAPRRVPRTHVVALAVVAVVGLVRGGFWVVATDVFSQVDEAQHYDYIRSMAALDGPPVVGEDPLAFETRRLAKESEAGWWRTAPLGEDPGDDRWGAAGESYEGIQPPLYYGLVAPVHRLARAVGGPEAAVFADRLATVVLALLAVPALYALARLLLPCRPAVWLLAPAALVLVPGFNANLGQLTNDVLTVPLGAAALAAFVWSARRRFPVGGGLACGALVALGALSKSTALSLVPFVGVAAVVLAVAGRVTMRRLAGWTAGAAAAMVALYGPWVLWNLATYGEPSAATAVDAITGPELTVLPRTVDGIWLHVRQAMAGLWTGQLVSPPVTRFSLLYSVGAAALVLAGVVALLARRDHENRAEAASVLWLAAAVPAAFVWMIAVVYGLFDGRGGVVGRHLYPGLAALVAAPAAAAVALVGRTLAPALIALALVPLAVDDHRAATRYVEQVYTWGNHDGRAPALVQSHADRTTTGGVRARIEAPCPTAAIGVGVQGEPPATLGDAPLVNQFPQVNRTIAVYAVTRPRGSLTVDVPPGPAALVSQRERVEWIRPSGGASAGTPVVHVYCARPGTDPLDERFAQLYGSAHPGWIDRDVLLGWRWVSTATVFAAAAAALGYAALRLRRPPAGADDVAPGGRTVDRDAEMAELTRP